MAKQQILRSNAVVGKKLVAKKGHFVVMAVNGNEPPQRFVVPLSCLTHPIFVSLLEQAAEEYGFTHEGALVIRCRPDELNKIYY